ncbi:MAG TPA: hypothetical protein IAC64_05920 [Candidatus Caccomorpha excrementavium]|nr:hypothetical protein [Candidatus Caccomorpha excrementavium]
MGSFLICSATRFSTSFRRQTGISPSEYRKQMRTWCMRNPSQVENLCLDETQKRKTEDLFYRDV